MTKQHELGHCPFCGGTELKIGDKWYWDDAGIFPLIECLDCKSTAQLGYWNKCVNAATESDERSVNPAWMPG